MKRENPALLSETLEVLRLGVKWRCWAVAVERGREKRWKNERSRGRSLDFFLTFDHCATRSDEIDDTSSAVTNETIERLMLASLRFLNTTFREQRHIVVHAYASLLSYRGTRWRLGTPWILPYDGDPLLIHDVSILPSMELTDVVRYAEYLDTRKLSGRVTQNESGQRSWSWVVLRCEMARTFKHWECFRTFWRLPFEFTSTYFRLFISVYFNLF